ncbi:uncharacterized protein LOC135944257 [Cloeon dipterum]|uniref:uncharacterized protein LOC135944257 n=1 Tax=Cloeon dipterum TaxID=197152 RepID=UPI00322009C9
MSSPPNPKKAKVVKVMKMPKKQKIDPGEKCIVNSCNSMGSNEATTKIKLPDVNSMRKEWLKICGRADLINSAEYLKYFICAEHFKAADFTGATHVKVRPSAKPSVFKTPPSSVKPINPNIASVKTYGKQPILPKPPGHVAVPKPAASPLTKTSAPNTGQQFFLLTPSEPNAAGVTSLILTAAQLKQQQIVVNPSASPTSPNARILPLLNQPAPGPSNLDKGTLESPPPAIDIPQPKPKAKSPPSKPSKMIISVPKSLYKEYKEGRVTLEQLTKLSKKPVNKDDLAKIQQIQSKGKIINPPKRVIRSTDLVLDEVSSTLASAPEPVAITKAPPLSEPPRPPRPLHQVEMDLNTPQISAQVHQVAPRLPIKARGAAYNLQKWDLFIPKTFRDWPVPASVLYAAAMQLKQNYIESFSGKERLEIETILHMVGHYTSLGTNSRCHVRERVHFYLKKMQQELLHGNELEAKRKRKRAVQPAESTTKAIENEQNEKPTEQEETEDQEGEPEAEEMEQDASQELPDLSDTL